MRLASNNTQLSKHYFLDSCIYQAWRGKNTLGKWPGTAALFPGAVTDTVIREEPRSSKASEA